MQRFQETVIDSKGNVIKNVIFAVFLEDGTTPAQIWADNSKLEAIAQPFVSTDGIVAFYADNGKYILRVQKDALTITRDIIMDDPSEEKAIYKLENIGDIPAPTSGNKILKYLADGTYDWRDSLTFDLLNVDGGSFDPGAPDVPVSGLTFELSDIDFGQF